MTRVLYNQVQKVWYEGCQFDSKLEVTRYKELKLFLAAKEISNLAYHPIPLIVTMNKIRIFTYEPDFTYIRKEQFVVEDVKGFQTPVFRLKWKILKAYYPKYFFELWPNKKALG